MDRLRSSRDISTSRKVCSMAAGENDVNALMVVKRSSRILFGMLNARVTVVRVFGSIRRIGSALG